ncbi:MAG: FecR domain-containing protein [bacterium]
MKIKIILILIALAIIASLGFIVWQNMHPKSTGQKNNNANLAEDVTSPWIEVTSGKVTESFTVGVGGQELPPPTVNELKTGDTLNIPLTIETNDSGTANIYWPDGSVMKLDKNSKITLETGEFDGQNNKLLVQAKLFSGRVWSKIIGLLTPDSSWQVQTSNAVATVRGTAFGMEYYNDISTIIGSEHQVSVSLIDFPTDRIISDRSTSINPGEIVAIGSADIAKIQADQSIFAEMVKPITPEIPETDWIKASEEADKQLQNKIDELKNQNLSGAEFRIKLKQKILGVTALNSNQVTTGKNSNVSGQVNSNATENQNTTTANDSTSTNLSNDIIISPNTSNPNATPTNNSNVSSSPTVPATNNIQNTPTASPTSPTLNNNLKTNTPPATVAPTTGKTSTPTSVAPTLRLAPVTTVKTINTLNLLNVKPSTTANSALR